MRKKNDEHDGTRVFAAHRPHNDKDTASAESVGEIVYLLRREDGPSLEPLDCLLRVIRGLRDHRYDPERDYVFWQGGDSLAMLFFGIAIGRFYPDARKIRYLRWERDIDDKTKGSYVEEVFPNAASGW